MLPELEVVIDDSLGFTLKVYGFYLPDDHELYSQYFRSVTNTSVANLVKEIESHIVCHGVNATISAHVVHHIIPKSVDHLTVEDNVNSHSHMKNTGKSKIVKFYAMDLISVHAAANLCKQRKNPKW